MIKNSYLVLFLLFAINFNIIAEEKKSTASDNVIVNSDSIYIKQLDRYRKIRIYLPPEYDNSNECYPVLYMHDAQNIFDDITSYAGEWSVDEILDSLYEINNFKLIIIGIDNGGEKRMNEYSPWENSKYGKPEGKEYVDYIVKNLKPEIDNRYRTLPGRTNTGIMGSSMGGLISHYAVFEYHNVFGKVGIFSPSYWYSKEVFSFTENKDLMQNTKIFMLHGGKENPKPTIKMDKLIRKKAYSEKNFKLLIDPNGEHNELFWKANFSEAVTFLFSKNNP